jgi:hypothetical protein
MRDRTRRWVLAGSAVLLAILLMACIKIDLGKSEPVVTPVPPTATPLPPTPTPVPPTPTPPPEAEPEIVEVHLCRGLTDDERPFAETNTYSELDPFVVSIRVAHLRTTDTVSAHWFQEGAVIGLTERDNVSGNTYIGLMLEPQTQWVPGEYALEVSLDGDIKETRQFKVIGVARLSDPGNKGGGGEGDVATEWLLYRQDDLGFSIEYPSNWLIDEDGAAVEFTHPEDIALALVLVDAKPAGNAEQEANAVFDILSQKLADVQLTSSEPQKDDWHGIFFTYNNNGTEIASVLLSKVVGSRGYNVIFFAVRKQWDSIVPTLEQMWASFEIAGTSTGGIGGAGEVLIEGLVRDSDSGRGIPDAVFVILKEGVTIQQFTDSGNDKSLVYDSAQSGTDGTFKTHVPVKRGATYAVFAVAQGYIPVVDVMTVSDEASNPWQVRVTMQKE